MNIEGGAVQPLTLARSSGQSLKAWMLTEPRIVSALYGGQGLGHRKSLHHQADLDPTKSNQQMHQHPRCKALGQMLLRIGHCPRWAPCPDRVSLPALLPLMLHGKLHLTQALQGPGGRGGSQCSCISGSEYDAGWP